MDASTDMEYEFVKYIFHKGRPHYAHNTHLEFSYRYYTWESLINTFGVHLILDH